MRLPILGRPRKRSLTLSRHRTSVSLEDAFWDAFQRMARAQGISVNALAARIDHARGIDVGLASAIRLAVLADLEGRLIRAEHAAPSSKMENRSDERPTEGIRVSDSDFGI